MKKLSAAHKQERDAIFQRLQVAASEIEEAEIAYNEAIAGIREPLNRAIAEYNEILNDAESWRAEIVDSITEYIDGRSEKWQESDAATAITEWLQEYEAIDLNHIEDVELAEEINIYSQLDLELFDTLRDATED